ncbi:MAG: arabinosyltransferase C-terminal domain-containing protein [Lawsonella clevelandensis]
MGVNGSRANCPSASTPKTTPVLGSFQYGSQHSAKLQTAWYSLPKADPEHPVIVFTAAGRLKYLNVNSIEYYGQPSTCKWHHPTDGSVKMLGQVSPTTSAPSPPGATCASPAT